MNILGCLDRPTTGSYLLNGKEVANQNDDALAYTRNKEIGFVFQSFNLIPRLSALDNVILPMIYGHVYKSERKKSIPLKLHPSLDIICCLELFSTIAVTDISSFVETICNIPHDTPTVARMLFTICNK